MRTPLPTVDRTLILTLNHSTRLDTPSYNNNSPSTNPENMKCNQSMSLGESKSFQWHYHHLLMFHLRHSETPVNLYRPHLPSTAPFHHLHLTLNPFHHPHLTPYLHLTLFHLSPNTSSPNVTPLHPLTAVSVPLAPKVLHQMKTLPLPPPPVKCSPRSPMTIMVTG